MVLCNKGRWSDVGPSSFFYNKNTKQHLTALHKGKAIEKWRRKARGAKADKIRYASQLPVSVSKPIGENRWVYIFEKKRKKA